MKSIFFFLLFFAVFSACSNAQLGKNTSTETIVTSNNISYEQWKKDAKSDIRLLPKFGNAVKNEAQNAADQELIEEYTKQEGTRQKGSEVLVNLGFHYYYQGDIKTAMYRFNQAWLLDPENENALWGFASVYFALGNLSYALEELNEGLKLNPKSTKILTDIATIHMALFQNTNDEREFGKAINLFKQSYAIDPKNQNTVYKLSGAYLMKNDCNKALKYYNECKSLGGKPITKEYVDAIAVGCKI
jgi:tetratricopeptide (TPR) repeat protein